MLVLVLGLLVQAGSGMDTIRARDPFPVTVHYTVEAPREESRLVIQTAWAELDVIEVSIYNMTTELAYEFTNKSFVVRNGALTHPDGPPELNGIRLVDLFGDTLARENEIGLSIRAGNGSRVIIDGLRMQIQ